MVAPLSLRSLLGESFPWSREVLLLRGTGGVPVSFESAPFLKKMFVIVPLSEKESRPCLRVSSPKLRYLLILGSALASLGRLDNASALSDFYRVIVLDLVVTTLPFSLVPYPCLPILIELLSK